MMFNVPQRMLDDILSGTGAVAMAKDRIRICDFYLMQVEDFESRATLAEKESMKGQMSIALLALLLDQGAWSTLAKTKLDGEKHLLVMDWGHKASRRSSHAIFQTPAGTLPSQDDLLTVSMQLYEKNYARQC
jgi:hypothetical protein